MINTRKSHGCELSVLCIDDKCRLRIFKGPCEYLHPQDSETYYKELASYTDWRSVLSGGWDHKRSIERNSDYEQVANEEGLVTFGGVAFATSEHARLALRFSNNEQVFKRFGINSGAPFSRHDKLRLAKQYASKESKEREKDFGKVKWNVNAKTVADIDKEHYEEYKLILEEKFRRPYEQSVLLATRQALLVDKNNQIIPELMYVRELYRARVKDDCSPQPSRDEV